MKIEQIDPQTIKVILTQTDMDSFDITYDDMDYKDPHTKQVILELLRQIKQEITIDFNSGKLFIEAFPYLNGGCVLYICTIALENEKAEPSASVSRRTGFNTPLVFEFDDINLLTDTCSRLLQQYNHIILRSALYWYENKYRLLIYSYFKLDNKIISLVKEYGNYIGKGTVQSSIVREHAKLLIENNAIETVSQYLD